MSQEGAPNSNQIEDEGQNLEQESIPADRLAEALEGQKRELTLLKRSINLLCVAMVSFAGYYGEKEHSSAGNSKEIESLKAQIEAVQKQMEEATHHENPKGYFVFPDGHTGYPDGSEGPSSTPQSQ